MRPDPRPITDAYPYADTPAARLLTAALARLRRKGVALREIAKKLNYRQATVLSHMANGRVRVPVARAIGIAEVVGLDPADFLAAALDQRTHTDKATSPPVTLTLAMPGGRLVEELEAISGGSLDELTPEQKEVLREVASDPRPTRRWLSPAEIPVIQMLRDELPEIRRSGLDRISRERLRAAFRREVQVMQAGASQGSGDPPIDAASDPASPLRD